jgi:(2Fe-2S) ferredoxin
MPLDAQSGVERGSSLMEQARYRVHLCCGPNCTRAGSRNLLPVLEAEIAAQGLSADVSVQETSCRNRCEQAPSMNVYPGPIFYNRLTLDAIRAIVRQHLCGGSPVRAWVFRADARSRPQSRFAPSAPEVTEAVADGADWRWWKKGEN